MSDLKTHLYAKFGNAINLETLVKTKESCNEEVQWSQSLNVGFENSFGNTINLKNDE